MEEILNKIKILEEENNGYLYEIWVYDSKGNIVKTYL